MAKIIRPTYPVEFSVGLLLLIFALSSFLSLDIFAVRWHDIKEGNAPVFGMALAGAAIVIMVLIVWEEFLFPVHIKPTQDKVIFKNHNTKLITQVLIYCAIPIIVIFIFLNYAVSYLSFFIWASLCLIPPVVGKLISGIKNYNDFLKLTNDTIAYKNNEKEGILPVAEIREIVLIKDEKSILHKIQVLMLNNHEVIIDLDEMELEAYYQTINEFIKDHYKALVK
jgi:hypothetical protein